MGNQEQLIPKLLKSLDQEILTAKNSSNKLVLSVIDGHFICKEGKNFLYKFILTSSINPIDNVQIELLAGGSRYNGNIVTTQDKEITLRIFDNPGTHITKASIIIKFSSIFEELKSKIKELHDSKKYQNFHLANHFFQERCDSDSAPAMLPGFENILKDYQADDDTAHPHDMKFSGKIKMLAHISGAFIKTDMKILIVSNNNEFIDESTVCLAENLKNTDFYKHGKIVNLSTQDNNELFANHELILLEKIVKNQSIVLNIEKAKLKEKIKSVDEQLMEFSQGLEIIKNRDNYFKKIKQLSDEITALENKIPNMSKNIAYQEKQIEIWSKKLKSQEKIFPLLKLFAEFKNKKLKNKILLKQKDTASKQQELTKLAQKKEKLEQQRNNITANIQNAHNKIAEFLVKYNLTENKLQDKYKELVAERETVKQKMTDIDSQYKLIRLNVLSNAKTIGATLNMVCLSNDIADLEFDLLIVDEASIPAEPQLYWALSKCKMAAIIVGDCLKFVVPSTSLG